MQHNKFRSIQRWQKISGNNLHFDNNNSTLNHLANVELYLNLVSTFCGTKEATADTLRHCTRIFEADIQMLFVSPYFCGEISSVAEEGIGITAFVSYIQNV
jgi:hypothetical protein